MASNTTVTFITDTTKIILTITFLSITFLTVAPSSSAQHFAVGAKSLFKHQHCSKLCSRLQLLVTKELGASLAKHPPFPAGAPLPGLLLGEYTWTRPSWPHCCPVDTCHFL